MIAGVRNFAPGITLLPRVDPSAQLPQMSKIDGWLADNGALTDSGGITSKSASAITPASPGQSPGAFAVDDNVWLITTQSNGKLRRIKPNLDAQDWVASDPNFAASMESDSRMVRCGKDILIPTTDGIKRLQPGWYERTTGAYDAVPLVRIHDCNTKWDDITAPLDVNIGRWSTSLRKEGDAVAAIQVNTQFAGNAELAADTIPMTDLSGCTYVLLWVWSTYACSANMLQLTLETMPPSVTHVETLNIPALDPGWNLVKLQLASPAECTQIQRIALRATANLTGVYHEFLLDDIWGAIINSTMPRVVDLAASGPGQYSAWSRPLIGVSESGGVAIDMCESGWVEAGGTSYHPWGNSSGLLYYGFSTTYVKEGTYSLQVVIGGASSLPNTSYLKKNLGIYDGQIYISAHTYLGLWIFSGSGAYSDKLQLRLYTDATCTDDAAHTIKDLNIPALIPGWQYVTIELGSPLNGLSYADVRGIGLRTTTNWDPNTDFMNIYMDSIYAVSDTRPTYWSGTKDYGYVYCFAGPSDRSIDTSPWIVSNPSDETVISGITVGQALSVICFTYNAPVDWDCTRVLVYRRNITDSETDWSYVGWADITSVGEWAYATFTDYGNTWTDVVEEGIDPILVVDKDVPDEARYLLATEDRVWGLCLDYRNSQWQSKTAIACSTKNKPWYWPTTTDGYSDGFRYDGYAIDGSEGRGWGTWQGYKLVFLDNEFFVLHGDVAQDFYMRRVDSVGLASQRSLADCIDMLIWLGPDDFYGWAGGRAQHLAYQMIDTSLIDLTAAHDAVFADHKYIFYCTYDSQPSLLIYNLATGGWVIRSCPELVGITCDSRTGTIYGVTATGYAVQVLDTSVTTDLSATRTYSAHTAKWTVTVPGDEVKAEYAILDVETDQNELTLDVHVYYWGTRVGHVERQFSSANGNAITSTKTRYTIGLDEAIGHTFQVQVTYTGEYPPTIYFVGIETNDSEVRP